MKFSKLAQFFLQIEETSSRLTMTETLSDLFKKIDVSEIDKVLYLLQGRVVPLYVKSDFGLGEKMVIRGIAQAFNIDQKLLITLFHKTGDLGKAVEKLREETISLYSKDLSVADVYSSLKKITETGGTGSQEGKLAYLTSLLQ
jgi:DNA ligase-1